MISGGWWFFRNYTSGCCLFPSALFHFILPFSNLKNCYILPFSSTFYTSKIEEVEGNSNFKIRAQLFWDGWCQSSMLLGWLVPVSDYFVGTLTPTTPNPLKFQMIRLLIVKERNNKTEIEILFFHPNFLVQVKK